MQLDKKAKWGLLCIAIEEKNICGSLCSFRKTAKLEIHFKYVSPTSFIFFIYLVGFNLFILIINKA